VLHQLPPSPGTLSWSGPDTATWCGDIDRTAVHSAGGEQAAVQEPPRVLDLTGVTWFSSAGMALLLGLVARARADGRRITVRGAPAMVVRRMDMVGAAHLLDWDQAHPGSCAEPTRRPE